jgi:type III restriction enzyme
MATGTGKTTVMGMLAVEAFVKNAGLGFAMPYLYNGQPHDYVPDFLIRLKLQPRVHLILETKGYDPLAHIKAQAAQRWVVAVNADGQYGGWHYAVAYKPEEVRQRLEETMTRMQEEATAAAEIP